MDAVEPSVKDEPRYVCAKCQEILTEDTLGQHPCLLEDELVGDQEGVEREEDAQVEFLEDPLETSTDAVDKTHKFRVKVTSNGRRGDWSDGDVQRLLEVYIKNYRELPMQKRLHNHYLWDRVMRDLQPYGNFSRFLVQAKIKKMKKAGRAIMEHGYESKWPYLSQVLEMIRLEDEWPYMTETENDSNSDGISDKGEDDKDAEVTGLRRWTIEETRHLIEVYKKHLPKFFTEFEPRKIAWDDILADLEYGLAERFSMYQIRAKIRNAQNTFRHIVEQKRKKSVTYWPLFPDLADLAKCERELAQASGVPIGAYRCGGLEDPDAVVAAKMCQRKQVTESSTVRWNTAESTAFLTCYKKYQPELLQASTTDAKNKIWKKICSEVNQMHRRNVSVREIQVHFDKFRQMWLKNENGLTVDALNPFFELMREIVEGEVECSEVLPGLGEDDGSEFVLPPPTKRKKGLEHLPQWYTQYEEATQRRHEEKIGMQEKILSLLGTLMERSQRLS